MKHIIKVLSRIFLISIFFNVSYLQANILIAPTKVTIEDRVRSEKIYLVNEGKSIQTYRFKWVEYKALETGGYRTLTKEEAKSFNTASQFIKFSPKQVTLKPDSNQVVKLFVRRPKDLADGEYRSHLKLIALPPKQKKQEEESTEAKVGISILLSYVLPVVVKQGNSDVTVSIEDIKLYYNKKSNDTKITVNLTKKGNYSAQGDIFVYWKPTGETSEKLVSQLNRVAFYHELDNLYNTQTIRNFRPSNGTFHVIFKEKKSKKIFAEFSKEVNSSSFLTKKD